MRRAMHTVVGLTLATGLACVVPPPQELDAGVDGGEGPDGGSVVVVTDPSCELTPPESCPSPTPTYGDIAPIISLRCAECHSGTTPDGPWPLNQYGLVVDWRDDIRGDLINCSMPPADAGMVMTRDERLMILSWIRCGTPQ